MFQILNLVKRLDATDVVMNKMVTLLEDLAIRQSIGSGKSNIIHIISKQKCWSPCILLDRGTGGSGTGSGIAPGIAFKEKSQELISQSQEIRKSLENSMGGSNQIKELINKMKVIEERIVQLERRPGTCIVY